MTAIPRRHDLDEASFIAEHLVANRPVIATGALNGWDLAWSPARWVDSFGAELVQVYNDLFDLIDVVSLASFVSRFMGEGTEQRHMRDRPYVRWYAQMKDVDFVWADHIFERIASRWSMPPCLPKHGYVLPDARGRALDPARDPFPAKGLFISGPGARTRLHRDPWASDAILCQTFGTKRVTMFAPELAPQLVRDGVVVDIEHPDPERFPAFSVAPTFEDELVAGELLYIPAGWYHHVVTVSDSVSVTWNFVHVATWQRMFRYLVDAPVAPDDLEVLRYFAAR
ncbi:hypothetical protein BH11MYX1_BH11MYX1_23510 [soil metagenome]